MNKRYPSTFRLTYYNDNGEVMGDPLTIDLTGESASAANGELRLWIIGNTLRFKIDPPLPVGVERSYLIQGVGNSAYIKKGTIIGSEGSIDVDELPSGVYTFTTIVDGKPCSAKWAK